MDVERVFGTFGIEQNGVMQPLETRRLAGPPPVVPNDFIHKFVLVKNGVHKALDVGMSGMVDVQVDIAIVCQHPVHLYQPHSEPTQECSHAFTVIDASVLDGLPHARIVVLNLINPFLVNVRIPTPTISE